MLFLHTGGLSTPEVTQAVCYPLWERALHVEPFVRTVPEAVRDVRRSWSATTRLLDARFISGDRSLFSNLETQLQSLRRDHEHLRHRLRADVQHRHATQPAATGASTPDLLTGRGGLLDLAGLRWLDLAGDRRTEEALEFLLATIETAEELTGHASHRLSRRILEQLEFSPLDELYAHARWVAFRLDNGLAPNRTDRQFMPYLSVRKSELVSDAGRLPPLHRAPDLGLRVANLVGLAPPSDDLLAWAAAPGQELEWDDVALEQFWLLLRAADWRAWDFLQVTGLLVRYLPEFAAIWHKPATDSTADLAVDDHSFQALRRLHEWSETDDPFAERIWRATRARDSVYLAVLLHELSSAGVAAVARRLRLPEGVAASVELAVGTFQAVLDTTARRDLHDEDLVLDLATRIGTRQRLSMLFLVAVAHELANGPTARSGWKADLLRQLFGQLESALRHPAEVGARRARMLEQHRERTVRELRRRGLEALVPLVSRLPRRYLLTRRPAFAAHHLGMLASGPLAEGEVRIQATRHRQKGLWTMRIVARDRPGLLSMVTGVLALRGASVLAADAATSSDGLVLDVFTVTGPSALQWPQISTDLQAAINGRIPLEDLLGARAMAEHEAALVHVSVDNSASQFFSVVEVRAPDEVGLLFRMANALSAEQLDIHHARIATYPEGALDVFYVRNLSGEKLSDEDAPHVAAALTARLRGSLRHG